MNIDLFKQDVLTPIDAKVGSGSLFDVETAKVRVRGLRLEKRRSIAILSVVPICKGQHKQKASQNAVADTPSLTVAVEGARATPVNVIASNIEECLFIFKFGVVFWKIDSGLELDGDILQTRDGDNALQVVSCTTREDHDTAIVAL